MNLSKTTHYSVYMYNYVLAFILQCRSLFLNGRLRRKLEKGEEMKNTKKKVKNPNSFTRTKVDTCHKYEGLIV